MATVPNLEPREFDLTSLQHGRCADRRTFFSFVLDGVFTTILAAERHDSFVLRAVHALQPGADNA